MTNMKTKNLLLSLGLGAVAALGASSCSDYTEWSESEIRHQETINEYTKNFVERYGEIDINHSWGFSNMPSVRYGTYATRAEGGYDPDAGTGAGVVDVNRNMWTEAENGSIKEGRLGNAISIPGWPNFDTKYYTLNSSASGLRIDNSASNDRQAAGDITEAEIQYVSNWFRSHKDPKSNVQLHLSDFFIQNVCADHDQIEYPTGKNIENTHESGVGSNITNTPAEGEGINYGMDHLVFRPIGGNKNTVDESWTHVNDFNNGNSNIDPENHKDKNNYRNIKFIHSSGTEDFAYTSSFATADTEEANQEDAGGTYYRKWVLMHLTWTEKGADGNTYTRDGYYLAFDYEANKDGSTHVAGDGYYSNWIIKITPADPIAKEDGFPRRIMCEDLGNTCDFDFNDVVYDVYFHEYIDNNSTNVCDAVITLQAAGGTMPIYVGNSSSVHSGVYEAHNMLGNSATTPVNVGGASHEVAIYRVRVDYRDTHLYSADDIKIYVHEEEIGPVRANLSDHYNGGVLIHNAGDAKYCMAPQKFGVPASVRWMKESQQIESAYPKFGDWVREENGTYGETNGTPWFSNSNMSSKASSVIVKNGNGYAGSNGGTSAPVYEDYSQYGDELIIDKTANEYSTEYRIAYDRFNSYGDNFVISVVCKATNNRPAITSNEDAKFCRARYISQPDWSYWDCDQNNPVGSVEVSEMDSNKQYVVTINMNKSQLQSESVTNYTHLQIMSMYEKGEQIKSIRIKNQN